MPTADLITLFVVPLNRAGIIYMATGSVAAMIYGEPRLTNDIDLVIAVAPGDAERFAAAYADTDLYVPPVDVISREAGREYGGHFNVIHGESALKADFYVAGGDALHQWALPLRRAVQVFGNTLWIAPPEYVMLRKLLYYRDGASEKHLRDVRRILAVSGDRLNLQTVDAWVVTLGIQGAWGAARGGGET